jgi:hypothetical protein
VQNNSYKLSLYASISFCASFLLFSIQPLFSKLLLPYFGGSSMVWIVSSVLFQLLLLLSYLYVFSLKNYSVKQQLVVHLSVAVVCFTVAFLAWLNVPLGLAAIFEILDVQSLQLSPQWVSIVAVGFQSIGLSVFLLGTSSTFIQLIVSKLYKTNPYLLYRASNAGSFLGLLMYPFSIEPLFSLHTQIILWTTSFIAVSLGMIGIAWIEKNNLQSENNTQESSVPPIKKATFARWLLLSAVPVAVLLAVTNHITTGVAPSPYLWIIPLALYLLSFICAFGVVSLSNYLVLLTLVSICLSLVVAVSEKVTATHYAVTICILLLTTFFTGLLFHVVLYTSRPAKQLLSYFYLTLSVGGVVGGSMVSILAPLVFNDYYELPILLVCVLLFCIWIYTKTQSIKFVIGDHQSLITSKGITISALLFLSLFTALFFKQKTAGSLLYSDRNFYGTVKVVDVDKTRQLYNGSIIHGSQTIEDPGLPSGYYNLESGVGKAVTSMQATHSEMKVAVVGLGAGTLASYCRENDQYFFYEINPQVVGVATQYFSYLESCEETQIIVGDGRKSLENEVINRGKFDLIVLDAFSDDSIPSHLLTKEAHELYFSLLNEGGVVAYHVSNRYLALDSVVYGFADNAEVYTKTVAFDEKKDAPQNLSSVWILASKKPDVIMAIPANEALKPRPEKTVL